MIIQVKLMIGFFIFSLYILPTQADIRVKNTIINYENTNSKFIKHIENDKHYNLRYNNEHLYQEHHDTRKKDNPLVDFIIGIALIVFSIPLLWYNERRSAINEYRIDCAQEDCTSVSCREVDPNNQNKLIHMCGQTMTNQLVTDFEFGVSEIGTIKIERKVEMYQWIKKTKKRNNHTDVYYEQLWDSEFHDSSSYSYGHTNEQSKWIVEKQIFLNKEVYIGQFELSDSLKQELKDSINVELNEENAKQAERIYGNKGHNFIQSLDNYIYFKQYQDQIIVGDLRVQFKKFICGDHTIISKQNGNSFENWTFQDRFSNTVDADFSAGTQYQFSETCSCCKFVRRLEQPIHHLNLILCGLMTKDKAFRTLIDENLKKTWLIRLIGFLLMIFGFLMLCSPVIYIISWFPFFGNFLAQLSTILFLIACTAISIPVTLLVITFAWLFYHPKIGCVLFVVTFTIGLGVYYYIFEYEKEQQQ